MAFTEAQTTDHSEVLMKVLQDYAPNSHARTLVENIWASIEKTWTENRDRDQAMCAILMEGLQNGNWPWSTPVITVDSV